MIFLALVPPCFFPYSTGLCCYNFLQTSSCGVEVVAELDSFCVWASWLAWRGWLVLHLRRRRRSLFYRCYLIGLVVLSTCLASLFECFRLLEPVVVSHQLIGCLEPQACTGDMTEQICIFFRCLQSLHWWIEW